MKILRSALALLLLGALGAGAAHLQINLQDFTTGTVGLRKITVTPVGIGNNGTYLVTGDPLSFTNSSAGLLTISNVLAGDYRITWGGLLGGSVVVVVPTNDVLVNASQITATTSTNASPTTTAFSQAAANARFLLRDQGYGTNLTLSNVVFLGTLVGISSPTSGINAAEGTNIARYFSTNDPPRLEAGTNAHLVTNGNTITVNVPGGGGEVSTAQLLTVSNTIAPAVKAEGALGTNYAAAASNNLYGIETTRNAAVSNALVTLVATASNNVRSTLIANDTTTSNGVLTAANAYTVGTSNTLLTLAKAYADTNASTGDIAAGTITASNLTAAGVIFLGPDGILTNTPAGTVGQIPTKRADGTWGVSNAPAVGGEVSTDQLNSSSNAVLALARDRADTDLLFYDSFTQTNWFGKTNWISDSGHYVRIMQPLNGTGTAADPYESGYMTNGWLGINASSNDSTFYLLVTLTNYVRTEPIELGIEWRYVQAGSGSNWSAADNESLTIANVGGDHPNWAKMVHMKFLQECTYFYASTWTNGAAGVVSLLPSGFPVIPFNTRLRAELTSPVPHQSSVIFWGDNSLTATMDGFSTNLWYYTLDAQTGTNFYFQLWQDKFSDARRWIEFNRIWIKKVADRRIPSFAGRYGPGITNAEGVAALALDAGLNTSVSTNGNRVSVAANLGGALTNRTILTNTVTGASNLVFNFSASGTNQHARYWVSLDTNAVLLCWATNAPIGAEGSLAVTFWNPTTTNRTIAWVAGINGLGSTWTNPFTVAAGKLARLALVSTDQSENTQSNILAGVAHSQ